MGAPNVVRGGSLSGNAAALDLAEAGHLDILSSDYVPAALLMAAFRLLAETPSVRGLPGAIQLVSKAPAEATGLQDRGEIALAAAISSRRPPRRRTGRARGLARRAQGRVGARRYRVAIRTTCPPGPGRGWTGVCGR